MIDRKRLERLVWASTEACGVPYHLEDPATVRKVVALLMPARGPGSRDCQSDIGRDDRG